jgi:hypothetical protein
VLIQLGFIYNLILLFVYHFRGSVVSYQSAQRKD